MAPEHRLEEPASVQLAVRNLRRSVGDNLIHSNLSFSLRSGEILFVRGPSGVGKSVLLRCLACLDPIDSGSLSLSGQPPEKWGLPRWRSLVTYVHQARIAHPGTPSQYYFRLQQLAAQRSRERGDLPSIVSSLGLEPEVLNQAWQELSGGQAQRVSLGIALALKPAILLLDEPTSSLDAASAEKVESALKTCGAGIVWVSHDPQQPDRVGGRVLNLPAGTEGQAGPGVPKPEPNTQVKAFAEE